jgi:hypothetical protein
MKDTEDVPGQVQALGGDPEKGIGKMDKSE